MCLPDRNGPSVESARCPQAGNPGKVVNPQAGVQALSAAQNSETTRRVCGRRAQSDRGPWSSCTLAPRDGNVEPSGTLGSGEEGRRRISERVSIVRIIVSLDKCLKRPRCSTVGQPAAVVFSVRVETLFASREPRVRDASAGALLESD